MYLEALKCRRKRGDKNILRAIAQIFPILIKLINTEIQNVTPSHKKHEKMYTTTNQSNFTKTLYREKP